MIDRTQLDPHVVHRSSPKSLWRCLSFAAFLSFPIAVTATSPQEVDPGVIDALARSMSDDLDHGDHFDAQVWLLSSVPKLARYVPNDKEQELILRTVYREANRHESI